MIQLIQHNCFFSLGIDVPDAVKSRGSVDNSEVGPSYIFHGHEETTIYNDLIDNFIF